MIMSCVRDKWFTCGLHRGSAIPVHKISGITKNHINCNHAAKDTSQKSSLVPDIYLSYTRYIADYPVGKPQETPLYMACISPSNPACTLRFQPLNLNLFRVKASSLHNMKQA
jgi:hypothetical protein